MTMKARIQKIEARLDALEKPQAEPRFISQEHRRLVDEMLHFINEGRYINAIKNYRTLTGAGLKESKDMVMPNGRR